MSVRVSRRERVAQITQLRAEGLTTKQVAERLGMSVKGVYNDRSDPADVALFNRLRLGHDVTLMVEGKCSQTGAKGATDREGDLDVTIGQRNVKVGTVYVPAGQGSVAA